MKQTIPIYFHLDDDAIVKADWIVNGVKAAQFEPRSQTVSRQLLFRRSITDDSDS